MSVDRSTITRLADRRDPDGRETYLSAHVDYQDLGWSSALDKRAGRIREALPDEDLSASFEAAWDRVREEVDRRDGRDGVRSVAVYASPAHGFEEVLELAVPVSTGLVLDTGPYVRPLARAHDDYEEFALVLLDGERAAIFAVEMGRSRREAKASAGLQGRHTKGGWSQMRFQRKRRQAQDRFFERVGERLQTLRRDEGIDRVIVAGPGQAKDRFVDRLPEPIADAVIAVEDVDFPGTPDEVPVRRFVDLGRALEDEDSRAGLEAVRAELLRDGLAVTGPFDVARAARDGRVELLVVDEDATAGGRRCDRHDAYFEVDATCQCGSEGTRVDLVEEAVEDTMGADGEVEFVADTDDLLPGQTRVAALTRW